MGVVIEAEGKTIYHTGDTGLFSDMKLIADRHPVDVCFVPIEIILQWALMTQVMR